MTQIISTNLNTLPTEIVKYIILPYLQIEIDYLNFVENLPNNISLDKVKAFSSYKILEIISFLNDLALELPIIKVYLDTPVKKSLYDCYQEVYGVRRRRYGTSAYLNIITVDALNLLVKLYDSVINYRFIDGLLNFI